MPHYADGTVARVGDFVVGKGYNIKDDKGEPRTIAGRVIQITPGSDTCNVSVAVTRLRPTSDKNLSHIGNNNYHYLTADKRLVEPSVEYGQCDHFRRVEDLA